LIFSVIFVAVLLLRKRQFKEKLNSTKTFEACLYTAVEESEFIT
jgi:hypothetical protein